MSPFANPLCGFPALLITFSAIPGEYGRHYGEMLASISSFQFFLLPFPLASERGGESVALIPASQRPAAPPLLLPFDHAVSDIS